MKSVIFGVGFIGTATGRKLKEEGHEVVGADNFAVRPEKEPGFPTWKIDICDLNRIEDFLRYHRPGVIYWFPARQGYSLDHSEFARVQVLGSYTLFEAIDKIKDYLPGMIVLASSQAIYRPMVNVTEEGVKDPPSVYGFSKLQQERAFRWFCDKRNIPIVAMRYSIVLGPGQALQSTESGLIRNWYHKWKAGEAPEIYGNGKQARDFVHVDDVVVANLKAAAFCRSCEFNIGGATRKISEMAKAFHEMTGCSEPVVTGEEKRPGGEYSMTSSSKRAERLLGWVAVKSPACCIREFLDNTGI